MESKKFLDNLSTNLKDVIARAISVATSLDHLEVTPSHLLFATAQQDGSVGAEIIHKFDFDTEKVFQLLNQLPKRPNHPATPNATMVLPNLNEAAKKVLEKAMLTAYEYRHNYVGTEHMLFGIVHTDDPFVAQILKTCAMTIDDVEEQIQLVLQSTTRFPDVQDIADAVHEMSDISDALTPPQQDRTPPAGIDISAMARRPQPQKQPNAVDVFTTDLTNKQLQKTIDPVIGREQEVERLIHILARRNKNNPILVGEPGVGKTAIVEGLAKRIVEGDVPDMLKRKRILSLDLTLLVAGTIYRGEFEGRLKQLVDEVTKNPNIILFIDEIHNIIGTGSNQGTMDAANILKPALARGQLRCIGATTITEYKKYISSDPALERRFQSIDVEEPNREEAIQILHGVKKYYDAFHGTDIEEAAIESAVDWSMRYIHTNFLPDKAIDLIDEAAASVRTARKLRKAELDLLDIEKEIERLHTQKEAAVKEEKYDAAITLKQSIVALEKRMAALQKSAKRKKTPSQKVTKEHVANALAKRLGVHTNIILENNWQKLHGAKDTLQKHIVGQDAVLDTVIKTLQRAHLRKHATRPFASFLFAGPSGVGKTALATHLANTLFHSDKALLRLDMSEFSESHGVSKLLGSPAGYVGYKDRNRFFDHIRRYPYSVVLFDEIDKAHPDVRKLLLQMLDEGVLKDSHGATVSLRHAIVILTTNVGAELYASSGIGFDHAAETDRPSYHGAVMDKIKEEFSSAVLGRIDAVNLFAPLDKHHIGEIIKRLAHALAKHMKETQDISIRVSKQAAYALGEQIHNVDTGARHVERAIEHIVHEQVAAILASEERKPSYTLTKKDGTFILA